MSKPDTGIEPIMFSFFRVSNYLDEIFHAGVFFEIAKQLEQKEAYRIISKTPQFVSVGNN